MIYLNDILIYNNNIENYQHHVKKILQKFKNANIQIDINKCEFHVVETKFLKMIIKRNKIWMNLKKIIVIQNWKTSQHFQQMQFFLKFINFYRRFIKNFSNIAKSLIKLTKKNASFDWTLICQIAFDRLKARVIKIFILAHFNLELETIVKSNSSNFIFVEILSQKSVNDVIKFIVFFFKSLLSTKCDYEIYDKKLLAIIRCFEKWKFELQFVFISIKMLIDHKNLEYFMITKKLNKRQIRWVEFLVDFNFVINYQSRRLHAKANSFIWRLENQLVSNKNDRSKQ